MYVSEKHKLLFVHIPKTGGDSVRIMMRKCDPKCYEHKEYHGVLDQVDADLFKDYFKFAVVRNSYELCASCYRYMTQNIAEERQEPNGLMEFIRGQLEISEISNDWQIGQAQNPFPVQLDYFSEEGKILIDKIFFYNKGLDSEMSDLKEKINFSGDLGWKKPGDRSHYYGEYNWKSYYNAKSIEYVKEVCRKDIEYFGFKFEEEI